MKTTVFVNAAIRASVEASWQRILANRPDVDADVDRINRLFLEAGRRALQEEAGARSAEARRYWRRLWCRVTDAAVAFRLVHRCRWHSFAGQVREGIGLALDVLREPQAGLDKLC